MPRLRHVVVLAALAVGVTGCSQTRTSGHVLHLAVANPAGAEHDPALRFFATRVARQSSGRLRIAFDDRWGLDGEAHEARLIGDLAHGAADLGVAHTRSLARAGARRMDALDAPMLVDRSSLQAAVIASPLSTRMLAGARNARLEGLALLAGPLARPVGTRGPIRGPADIHDHENFDIRDSPVAARAVQSFHAFARPLHLHWLTATYVSGARTPQAPEVYEDDLDSLFFDRYGAQCADPDRGCRTIGPWVTVNVALWPRMSAIVANPAALARLSPRERAWLRSAAAATARYSTTVGDADQRALAELCAAGVRAVRAPRSGIAGLAHRWRPLWGRLPARRAIRLIKRLRRTAPPDPPLQIPAGCGHLALHEGPARGVRSSLPDGVYRVRITRDDLRAAAANTTDDRAGVATLTLRGGRWRLRLTEPGEHVEAGTYAGTPLRTAWASEGPRGRDEAYMSIAVDRDRTLRFSVVRADDLAHVRAIYGSHPWRRIGS